MEVTTDLVILGIMLLAAGGVAGITAGLFGVGCGFIVVPALLAVFPLYGEASEKHIYVAIGTSLATIIVSSARSVQTHHKVGAVDLELLRQWAPWLVVDVIFAIGVFIYSFYFLMPNVFTFEGKRPDVPDGAGRAALASGLGGYCIPALLAISLMSIFTAPMGAKLAHSLSEIHLKRTFGVYLLCVSATMFYKNMTVIS
jgi:uncharacterized membrane protein YfcA